jgi:hypothetical protein
MWKRSNCQVPVSLIEHPAHFAFQGIIYNVCDAGLYLETGYRIQPSHTLILRLSDDAIMGQRMFSIWGKWSGPEILSIPSRRTTDWESDCWCVKEKMPLVHHPFKPEQGCCSFRQGSRIRG